MAKVYLLREHIQVGDELIQAATLDKAEADAWAKEMCEHTKTSNFDVVEMELGRGYEPCK